MEITGQEKLLECVRKGLLTLSEAMAFDCALEHALNSFQHNDEFKVRYGRRMVQEIKNLNTEV